MSGNTQVMNSPLAVIGQHVPTAVRLIYRYFIRTNPIKALLESIILNITTFLTLSQQLKAAKRHVNHMAYRLNQMERLIESNNPANYISGRKINQIR
jgi:hypothetical protein